MYRVFFKRAIDIIVASGSLILLAPILVIVALFLMGQNNGNPFFLQVRPGRYERSFKIIKFKTMNNKRDKEGCLLPDNERITPLGKLVRKTSLDELPQLINVLRGDMSLVGPRPLLYKYIPLYSSEQKRRHEVRPGITGWAQVNGRNSISWTKKFAYDIDYVNNISFKLDWKILWLTLQKVLKREGINQSAERPMQPFNGSN